MSSKDLLPPTGPQLEGMDYLRQRYCLVVRKPLVVYHLVNNSVDINKILVEGFKPLHRTKLHLAFIPNIFKYPVDRLLAVEFQASITQPLTIFDLTKLPPGPSEFSATEFQKTIQILGAGYNDLAGCLKVGFPGYIGPCTADDRVSVCSLKELVLYDFWRTDKIRLPTKSEIDFLKRKCEADRKHHIRI